MYKFMMDFYNVGLTALLQDLHHNYTSQIITNIINHIMLKVASLIIILLFIANLITSIIVGHLSNYYNPNIKSNYSGAVASLIGISACLLLLAIHKVNYHDKLLTVAGFAILILGILATVFQFVLGFYFGAWAGLLWILLAVIFLFGLKKGLLQFQAVNSTEKNAKQIPLNTQVGQRINSEGQLQNDDNSQSSEKKCCTAKKCCSCCHGCCSITTILLMALFTIMAIVYFSNLNQFPIYGQVVKVETQFNGAQQKFDVQFYCVGEEQTTRPTIVMEHGGGSNSIAFTELGRYLATKQWKLCSYDRLGYGRSSVIPRYQTVQQRAQITKKVVDQMLINHTNKNIIMGGWSAGVQLSQIYTKIYPSQVQGMLFLDGYPDYLTLMAIQDNKTEKYSTNTLGVLWITRALQSLGLGLIAGSNPLSNVTANKYYQGYYQTGYFWESQYFQIANPNKGTTNWLTEAAGSSTKPYPSSAINLNWPDISVPLLVLPAKDTVSKDDKYSPAYLTQCQKYIDKCTSANKQLTPIEGDHGFVLKNPQLVSQTIDSFFRPLF